MLGAHKKAVLQFSGGKDSTALLYLARQFLGQVSVVFCDTGAIFPHVVKFVSDVATHLQIKLDIVRPEIPVSEHIDHAGLPADIIAVDALSVMSPCITQHQKLQTYFDCCNVNIWQPLNRYVKKSGATLVLRGVKKSDTRKGVPPGTIEDGVQYDAPLWDWTDGDVYAYLAEQGVTLPAHYPAVNDSLDCWLCTAHLAHHGFEKMLWLREHYPELWPEVAERLGRVRAELLRHAKPIGAVLELGAMQ